MHSCILHVENVGQDIVAAEVEEAGAEGQEEQQPQEYEVADQVEAQALEANFANPDLQEGKHWFILKPRVFYTNISFMHLLKYTCALCL